MIFLIDAQLPRRLARMLQQYGHQAYHTLDLPQQNRTDDDIMQFADTHDRIIMTKDSDFVDDFIFNTVPKSFGCSPQRTFPTMIWMRSFMRISIKSLCSFNSIVLSS